MDVVQSVSLDFVLSLDGKEDKKFVLATEGEEGQPTSIPQCEQKIANFHNWERTWEITPSPGKETIKDPRSITSGKSELQPVKTERKKKKYREEQIHGVGESKGYASEAKAPAKQAKGIISQNETYQIKYHQTERYEQEGGS
jgi:hypothetical protein